MLSQRHRPTGELWERLHSVRQCPTAVAAARGLAQALMLSSLRILEEQGMTEAALGVDTENISGALRLFERCGFRPARSGAIYRKPLL